MKHPWLYGLVMLCLALPAWASRTTVGNLELHAEAMPTTALTPEAAANYRVIPSAERGLLLVTVLTDMATATPKHECRHVRALTPSPSPACGRGELREVATRLSR